MACCASHVAFAAAVLRQGPRGLMAADCSCSVLLVAGTLCFRRSARPCMHLQTAQDCGSFYQVDESLEQAEVVVLWAMVRGKQGKLQIGDHT
jgi:hypothetical protein